MTPAVFPEFLHVYQAENDCDHTVNTEYSPDLLIWVVYHDGQETYLIEDPPPSDPNVLRRLYARIIRQAHSVANKKRG